MNKRRALEPHRERSLLCVQRLPTRAATRPQYGGTLRVEVRQSPETPDPPPLLGPGFTIARWEAGRLAVYEADENAAGGRPFLDRVEIQMGRSLRDQAGDLDLGKADIVELGPNELRRQPPGRRVWSSSPVRVLALVFAPRFDDARVREALALAVDRSAIHNVLLQRQGEISGALLPQWLSGYAFLFPAAADLARARQLAAGARPITLGVSDPAARPIAERIALNARDAGLAVSVTSQPAGADVSLVELRIASTDPAKALGEIAAALGLPARAAAQHARTNLRRGTRPARRLSRHPADSPPRYLRRRPARPRRSRHRALRRVALREPLAGRRAPMKFRTRLLLIFTAAIVASVAVVDLLVLGSTRRAFERSETQRAEALVLQFRKEFDRRRRELVRTVNAIAASEAVRHIAVQPDYTEYYDYAAPQAATHDLDLLELVAADGAIVSSAQWPARFGYKEDWLTTGEDWQPFAAPSSVARNCPRA